MKKILMVLEAGDALPSGIVRGLIYRDLFAEKGYRVRYISRIPASWVRTAEGLKVFLFKKNKKKNSGGLIKLLLGALIFLLDWRVLRAAENFDVVYLSKVRSPWLIQRLKKKTRARLVYDFGDAIWLAGRHSNQLFETDKFEQILSTVDAVTTDCEETASHARRFNRCVVTIPDYPQTEIFDAERARGLPKKDESKVVIGWIGSPSTVYNLYEVWEALEAVFSKHKNIELRLVGSGADPRLLPQFENVRYTALPFYSQKDMVREAMAMDIGIFPLQNTEASRVRGILKATVYMSASCAVVCSPVGQCAGFIRDGVNGFLAQDTGEWTEKLDRLITDASLRKRIGESGLESVRAHCSLRNCFEKLTSVLEGSIECDTPRS